MTSSRLKNTSFSQLFSFLPTWKGFLILRFWVFALLGKSLTFLYKTNMIFYTISGKPFLPMVSENDNGFKSNVRRAMLTNKI